MKPKDLRYHSKGFQCTGCGKKLFISAAEARDHCKYEEVILDSGELSGEAFDKLQDALKKMGLHLGDVEQEYFGDQVSDTWLLYIGRRKIKKAQLGELFDIDGDVREE